jgi:hypothetical protein
MTQIILDWRLCVYLAFMAFIWRLFVGLYIRHVMTAGRLLKKRNKISSDSKHRQHIQYMYNPQIKMDVGSSEEIESHGARVLDGSWMSLPRRRHDMRHRHSDMRHDRHSDKRCIRPAFNRRLTRSNLTRTFHWI